MKNLENVEKLNELIESNAYLEAFDELREIICSKRANGPRRFRTWHFPNDWNGDFAAVTKIITAKQFRRILKEQNVNDHWVIIPSHYTSFRDRWRLEYFFDPTREFPVNFNPLIRRDAVRPCFPPMTVREFDDLADVQYDPYVLHLAIDVRFPSNLIVTEVRKEIKEWIIDLGVETSRGMGRPKSRSTTQRLVTKAWEEYCKGKKMTGYQQCKKIAEEIEKSGEKSPDPMTIYRHYLPRIKKKAKKR